MNSIGNFYEEIVKYFLLSCLGLLPPSFAAGYGTLGVDIWKMDISQDQKFAAIARFDQKILEIWNLESCQKLTEVKKEILRPNGVTFSSDGKIAGVFDDSKIELFDFDDTQLKKRESKLCLDPKKPCSGNKSTLIIPSEKGYDFYRTNTSEQGRLLYSVWSTSEGETLGAAVQLKDAVHSLATAAYSKNMQFVALMFRSGSGYGGVDRLQIIDLYEKECSNVLLLGPISINSLAADERAAIVVFVGKRFFSDNYIGVVDTKKLRFWRKIYSPALHVHLSNDGSMLIVKKDGNFEKIAIDEITTDENKIKIEIEISI